MNNKDAVVAMLRLELGGKEDQKEDEIGRCFMLTFNGDPVVANDFVCLNLDMNGRGVACIKMSHDSEGRERQNKLMFLFFIIFFD